VKYIFFTTGYTTGYGLLVAFVLRFAVRVGDFVRYRRFARWWVRIPRMLFCFLVTFHFQIHYIHFDISLFLLHFTL